jgi:hypothetical protein
VLAYRALHAGVPLVLGVIGLADARRLLRDPAQAVAQQSAPAVATRPRVRLREQPVVLASA